MTRIIISLVWMTKCNIFCGIIMINKSKDYFMNHFANWLETHTCLLIMIIILLHCMKITIDYHRKGMTKFDMKVFIYLYLYVVFNSSIKLLYLINWMPDPMTLTKFLLVTLSKRNLNEITKFRRETTKYYSIRFHTIFCIHFFSEFFHTISYD